MSSSTFSLEFFAVAKDLSTRLDAWRPGAKATPEALADVEYLREKARVVMNGFEAWNAAPPEQGERTKLVRQLLEIQGEGEQFLLRYHR